MTRLSIPSEAPRSPETVALMHAVAVLGAAPMIIVLGVIFMLWFVPPADTARYVVDAPPAEQPAAEPPAPQTLEPGVMVEWDMRDGSRALYRVGDWSFELAYDEEELTTWLTASAPGVPPMRLGGSGALGAIGVGEVDRRRPGSEVIFTIYSMGAHCCTSAVVLELASEGWRRVGLGAGWDGAPLERWPQDVDGDGVPDLRFYDNAFLYAFESYAGSVAPPRILNVDDGEASDVSAEARYRSFFREEMEQSRADCRDGGWGACAGFAGNAARAGEFEAAWRFVLEHYDREFTLLWELPTACAVERQGYDCPDGQEMAFDSYPDALAWFLLENGYIDDLPAGTGEGRVEAPKVPLTPVKDHHAARERRDLLGAW